MVFQKVIFFFEVKKKSNSSIFQASYRKKEGKRTVVLLIHESIQSIVYILLPLNNYIIQYIILETNHKISFALNSKACKILLLHKNIYKILLTVSYFKIYNANKMFISFRD